MQFSPLYPPSVDIIFSHMTPRGTHASTIARLLNEHYTLLVVQGKELASFAVDKALPLLKPLRLHPSVPVHSSVATTYLYLATHANDSVRDRFLAMITEDLARVYQELIKENTGTRTRAVDSAQPITYMQDKANALVFDEPPEKAFALNIGYLALIRHDSKTLSRVLEVLTREYLARDSFHAINGSDIIKFSIVSSLYSLWKKKHYDLQIVCNQIASTLSLQSTEHLIVQVIQWLVAVIEHHELHPIPNAHLFLSTCVSSLLSIAHHPNNAIRLQVGKTLLMVVGQLQLPNKDLVSTSILRLSDNDSKVRTIYKQLLAITGKFYVPSWNHSQTSLPPSPQVMVGLLRPQHFVHTMQCFSGRGKNEDPIAPAHEWSWLLRLYATYTGSTLDNIYECGLWASWECARFCVGTRLKTPFGGPMQTFEAIERMLIMAASQVSVLYRAWLILVTGSRTTCITICIF